MAEAVPVEKFRLDYRAPEFAVEHLHLEFRLAPEDTQVRATTRLRRRIAGSTAPLVLDGRDLLTESLQLDGRELEEDEYTLDDDTLTILAAPDSCELTTVVRIAPERNTSLSGLYRSNGVYCTQCEAEGFRKITYFPDRPDVMTRL